MPKTVVMVTVLAAALASTTACSPYRVVGTRMPASTPVRVLFSVPRDVMVRAPAGDSTLLAGVRELRGEVASMQPDTLHLVVQSVRRSSDALDEVPSGSTAVVRLGADTRIEAKPQSAGATPDKALRVALVLAALASLVLVLMLDSAIYEP